jgi:hypothetical protein
MRATSLQKPNSAHQFRMAWIRPQTIYGEIHTQSDQRDVVFLLGRVKLLERMVLSPKSE